MDSHPKSYFGHETELPPNPMFQKIRARWFAIDSMAGVGLDPDPKRIPQEVWDEVGGRDHLADGLFLFNRLIIDATAPHVVDYKINAHFYEGSQGREALRRTFAYLKNQYPETLRVCDGKFADIGNTAERLADEIFGELDADAVLVNPYMGEDAITPFTRWAKKAVIICVNTSNASAETIQDIPLADGTPLWRHILRLSLLNWNKNGNVIPVLSATHPHNLVGIRQEIGEVPILLAGVGVQCGCLDDSIRHCLDKSGYGMLISSSRGVLYPEPLPGEHFTQASTRALVHLKNCINEIKGQIH